MSLRGSILNLLNWLSELVLNRAKKRRLVYIRVEQQNGNKEIALLSQVKEIRSFLLM